MIQQDLPIAIIGSGPIGLAAAAHLYQLNIPFLVFEKGEQVGSNILAWSHVTFFSSWTLNMDKVCIELLENSGWTTPQDDIFPTGHEFLAQYLVPLFQLPEINNHIHLNHKVKSVSRYHTNKSSNKRDQPFELCIINDKKQTQYIYAKGVIDASGTWQNMNPIGGSGYYLKEEKTNEHITYGIPDILGENKQDYWGMITAVFGNGHSAINVLLDLLQIKKQANSGKIYWVIRNDANNSTTQACKPDILPERSSLSISIWQHVEQGDIHIIDNFIANSVNSLTSERILIQGRRNSVKSVIEVNKIIACTGGRPDLSMIRELQVSTDPVYESAIGVSQLIKKAQERGDAIPEPHGVKALTQPEPDFFIVGMKSHGRAPNFFLMSGYEQVRSICAYFNGDLTSAHQIQFAYPDNGICGGACAEGNCCGPATAQGNSCGGTSTSAGCCG